MFHVQEDAGDEASNTNSQYLAIKYNSFVIFIIVFLLLFRSHIFYFHFGPPGSCNMFYMNVMSSMNINNPYYFCVLSAFL
jgi:hypothetical protein